MKTNYSKENLEKLVKDSWCFTDLSKKLGCNSLHKKRLELYLNNLNIDYSHFRKQRIINSIDYKIEPKTDLQKNIINLRNQGYSFSEITKQLHCSKSSVSYCLRKIQRNKVRQRVLHYKKWEIKLSKSLVFFKRRKTKRHITKCNDWKWNYGVV